MHLLFVILFFVFYIYHLLHVSSREERVWEKSKYIRTRKECERERGWTNMERKKNRIADTGRNVFFATENANVSRLYTLNGKNKAICVSPILFYLLFFYYYYYCNFVIFSYYVFFSFFFVLVSLKSNLGCVLSRRRAEERPRWAASSRVVHWMLNID